MAEERVHLASDEIAEWFSLGFMHSGAQQRAPQLVIDFLAQPLRSTLQALTGSANLVQHRDAMVLRGYSPKFPRDVDRHWGFGGVMTPAQLRHHQGWRRVTITIPCVVKKKSNQVGDALRSVECILATLSLLGGLLHLPSRYLMATSHESLPQLLTCGVYFVREGPPLLTGCLSDGFMRYLNTKKGELVPEVTLAMQRAHEWMYTKNAKQARECINARVNERGELLIEGPEGSRLYTLPDRDLDDHPPRATTFVCEADTSPLVLLLFCGLAELTHKAHKAYPRLVAQGLAPPLADTAA